MLRCTLPHLIYHGYPTYGFVWIIGVLVLCYWFFCMNYYVVYVAYYLLLVLIFVGGSFIICSNSEVCFQYALPAEPVSRNRQKK